jgi:hypothetical protein
MKTLTIEQREADIQKLCNAVLEKGIESTGDHGPGGQCPFCYVSCGWNQQMHEFTHKPDCAYLIAKDLSTGYK